MDKNSKRKKSVSAGEDGLSEAKKSRISPIPDETQEIHDTDRSDDITNNTIVSITTEALPDFEVCENIVIASEEHEDNVQAETSVSFEPTNEIGENGEDTIYQCSDCGLKCSVLSDLKEHYKVHRISKPFGSWEIGYECKGLPVMKEGFQSPQKTFFCPVCEFSSSSNIVLKEHISFCHTKDAPFVCSECKVVFDSKKDLANHLLVHTLGKPYKCPHCDFSSEYKQYMKAHMNLLHSEDKSFGCIQCSYTCEDEVDLAKHEHSHKSKKPFNCPKCKFRTKSLQYLKKHVLVHKGVLPFHCSVCDFRCVSKALLRSHYINHHTQEKPFKCWICSLSFKRNTALNRHLLTHTETKPYACPVCDYRCRRKDSLKAHFSLAHTDVKPFKCSKCDFSCKLKNTLLRHVNFHSPTRPFACERCNYRFNSENKLRHHAVSHTFENPYSCSHCSFHCKTKNDLNTHIHFIHGITDSMSCKLCNFVCKKAFTLRKHMEMHGDAGAFPYQCKQCNAQFSELTEYKRHLRSHISAIIYHCSFCSFDTNIKSYYEKHLQTHPRAGESLKRNFVTIHIDSEDSPVDCPKIKIESNDFLRDSTALKADLDHMEILRVNSDGGETICVKQEPDEGEYIPEEPTLCIVSEDGADGYMSHVNSTTFSCPHCPFVCFNKSELRHHKRTHKGGYYQCHLCGETFKAKTDLKHHQINDHKDYRPYQCEHCGREFKILSNLKQHSVIHSDDKPYQCMFCDYKAKLRETLRRHYVTHSAEKPFQCDVCNYRCKLKEKLKRHMLIHSDLRPFQCSACDHTSKTRELMRKHLIVHTRDRGRNAPWCKQEIEVEIAIPEQLEVAIPAEQQQTI